jgi:histone H3/H4
MRSDLYERVRGETMHYLQDLIAKAITFMEHARRKTVSLTDVKEAMRIMVSGEHAGIYS